MDGEKIHPVIYFGAVLIAGMLLGDNKDSLEYMLINDKSVHIWPIVCQGHLMSHKSLSLNHMYF